MATVGDESLKIVHACQTLDQRGLASAVFAHQRVDLAPAEVKIHTLIGRDAVGIHLRDPFHLDDIFLVQTAGFFVWHTICSSLSLEKVVRMKKQ